MSFSTQLILGRQFGLVTGGPNAHLPNPGWESGDAGGWTFTAGSGVGAAATVVTADASNAILDGTYALRVNRPAASTSPVARIDMPHPRLYSGFQVDFSVSARRAPLNTGSRRLRIQITASPDAGVTFDFALSDTYAEGTVTKVCPAGTTLLRLFINLNGGSGAGAWNVDRMKLKISVP